VNSGTLEFVPNAIPAGSGAVTFTGNSTLRWVRSSQAPGVANTTDLSTGNGVKITGGVNAILDTNGNAVSFASPIQTTGGTNGSLTKAGAGTLALSGNNAFTGVTTVDAGTLAVSGSLSGTAVVNVAADATFLLQGGANSVNATAAVNVGVPSTTGATDPASFVTSAASQTLGVFTLAGDSVIDFGGFNASAQLKFADSSARSSLWNGGLSIFNWTGTIGSGGGADQLFFGSSAAGLTQSQLNSISFYSDAGLDFLGTAKFAAAGEVVPVPEPASLVSILGSAGLLLGLRRRSRSGKVSV
jgi:autotransporter-associated beta strand protein